MGLITNSGSFSRFQVNGDGVPSKDFKAGLKKMIGRFAFRDLKEDAGQIRSVGWVNIMDMFDSRFAGLEFLKEPYIALSLRVDEKKVPSTTLKRYCLEAEAKIKLDEVLDFLPKRRRLDIKDGVNLRLLKRALPGSSHLI